MNFDRLRLVTELADVGALTEAMLATTIPERHGSFKAFLETALGDASLQITEFKYRCDHPFSVRTPFRLRSSGSVPDPLQIVYETLLLAVFSKSKAEVLEGLTGWSFLAVQLQLSKCRRMVSGEDLSELSFRGAGNCSIAMQVLGRFGGARAVGRGHAAPIRGGRHCGSPQCGRQPHH